MIRGKTPSCKGEEGKVVKKSGEEGQSFIVTLPEKVDGLAFTLTGQAQTYSPMKNIVWLRAREVGTEMWSQTIWAEVHPREGEFTSDEIRPNALWLVPNTTYEIEVAPETLEMSDVDLRMEPKKVTVTLEEGVRVERKESVLVNPIFWAAVLAIALVGMLMLIRR